MTATLDVAALVGSLRKESLTRKIVLALREVAPPNLKLRLVEIGDLPLYDPDLDEGTPPAPWARLRDEVRPADALLFATPEYNRSIPGPLKNALDVGSRPYGQSVWDAKPGAVISVSPGALGAFGANHHLRQSLVFLNVPVMQQPEAYVGGAAQMFDSEGRLTKDDTGKFLAQFMARFANWIERNLKQV